MTLLNVRHVSKAYDRCVLDNVSLAVEKGEIICLLGKSGSGKSTLLNIITGIEKADTGEVECRETLAYMQQKDLLLPFKTVLDNVLLPKALQGRVSETTKEQARQLLDELELNETAQRYPHELSGGMRQRVAFARTIMSERRLLLLDEPFGALDFITRSLLQKWYLSMSKQYELTTLLVTHDIDEALILGDKIALLDEGRLSIIKQLPKNKQDYTLSTQYLLDKEELLSRLTNSQKGLVKN